MSGGCKLTELADQDVFDISVYIAQNRGIDTAKRFIDKINEKFQLLVKSPEIGRSRSELADGLRSLPYDKYIIFYRIVSDGILVVRILHGSRDIPSIFEAENDI